MRTFQYLKVNQLTTLLSTPLFSLDFRQMRKDKDNGNYQKNTRQNEIRQFHGVSFKLNIAFPASGIVGRNRLPRIFLSAQHQLTQEHGSNKCTQAIE